MRQCYRNYLRFTSPTPGISSSCSFDGAIYPKTDRPQQHKCRNLRPGLTATSATQAKASRRPTSVATMYHRVRQTKRTSPCGRPRATNTRPCTASTASPRTRKPNNCP
ncbi:hypothetical protein BD311DRAFT_766114 [Dichomitus squalens]|uniref:Uncharacterized protein n=1 Tax=Dichomitus squalens TaxID=114155 RepID=A0A4Q9MBK3_9APHY|nr:hypothetical protein BD311DRAFT_766114 [Dichomitus squalens]